ncbi:MAG: AmmeMemoRadiSam system protein A [Vicinamibacterales bacterium]
MLARDERERLLRLARRCLEARVRREPPPAVERGGSLDEPMGVFVTIHTAGELRGCLGQIETDRPLADSVAHLAAVVCDSDPRFTPLCAAELAVTLIEISALTPEEEVRDVLQIEVGRHGLIVEHGRRRGLLLPQVATEHGWDRDAFLVHTCLKAGLPVDAWRRGARILRFEAQVFGEVRHEAERR